MSPNPHPKRSQVEEARRLIALGTMAKYNIAKKVGLSRELVTKLAKGYDPPRMIDDLADDYRYRHLEYPPTLNRETTNGERCPECGGIVRMPCLACKVKSISRSRKLGCAS